MLLRILVLFTGIGERRVLLFGLIFSFVTWLDNIWVNRCVLNVSIVFRGTFLILKFAMNLNTFVHFWCIWWRVFDTFPPHYLIYFTLFFNLLLYFFSRLIFSSILLFLWLWRRWDRLNRSSIRLLSVNSIHIFLSWLNYVRIRLFLIISVVMPFKINNMPLISLILILVPCLPYFLSIILIFFFRKKWAS